jgi:hypothetical protein
MAPCDVVGPSPRSGEAVAPPRSRSSLSSEVEVESEPWVGRGGDHCLRPRLSPSPGVGRGGVRRLPEPRPSLSPGVGRGGVRRLPEPRSSGTAVGATQATLSSCQAGQWSGEVTAVTSALSTEGRVSG